MTRISATRRLESSKVQAHSRIAEPYSILIVDDNSILREVLRQELTAEGYTVAVSEDGEAGLAFMEKYHTDLVLLDITLPKMDGLEVLKLIKRDFPETKVVMITAHSDVYHAMESRKHGADDFVGKPYDFTELLVVINRLRAM